MKFLRISVLLIFFCSSVTGQITLTGKVLPKPSKISNMLFYLQRSKNTNTVIYEAKIDGSGRLSRERPVDAYWLHYELNNGVRAELSKFEEMAVYGVTFEDLNDGTGNHLIRLKAFKARTMTLAKNKFGKYVGLMTINGKPAEIKRIYIEAKEGFLMPTVVHVDLFGIDPVTGEKVFERLFP